MPTRFPYPGIPEKIKTKSCLENARYPGYPEYYIYIYTYMILINYEGILWDMGGYGANGARWDPRAHMGPLGPHAPLVPYPPISPHIPQYPPYPLILY